MAERIKSYRFTKSFKKQYKRLPNEIKETFDKKLQLFLEDMSHPSLRVKRIQGTKDRWEGSITMKYRFTFQIIGGTVIFRAIGSHRIIR